ncbi:MAG: phosphoesterase [Patescibacteria group bacterium]|nr:phosphoesterase [Patescibacteria group bacterium]MDE2116288.1 phosphoesterase [Patescibacteria group bacterium]
MKTIAIYHKDCTDGTTAAAIVLRKYPEAMLFPIGHGYAPEEMTPIVALAGAPGESQIFTVDGVFGATEFLAAGHNVVSLDHHEGIRDEYKKLAAENKDFTFIFDNDKSGASLAWQYFFPDMPMPELVKLVEDQDLWKWRYSPDTENAGAILWMYNDRPQELLPLLDSSIEPIKKEGAVITRYNRAEIHKLVEEIEPLDMKIGDATVPVYNVPAMYRSAIGNILSERGGKTVGLFTIEAHEARMSFRGKDGQEPSALDIAKKLGGGGHKNAAGARVPLADFFKSIGI